MKLVRHLLHLDRRHAKRSLKCLDAEADMTIAAQRGLCSDPTMLEKSLAPNIPLFSSLPVLCSTMWSGIRSSCDTRLHTHDNEYRVIVVTDFIGGKNDLR